MDNKTNNEQKYRKALWVIMERLLEIDSIEEALSGALEEIINVMESEAGAIWMLDEKKGILHPVFHMGQADLSNVYVENGIGIEGVVTSSEKSIMISDTMNDPRFVGNVFDDQGLKTESLICVPLKAVKCLACFR